MNTVILKGNLTAKPELRFLPKGTATAQVGIAVNRKWRDQSTAELKEEAHFFRLVFWGKQAEAVTQYTDKGSPLLVQGRLAQERWQDKATGKEQSKTTVVVESFEFLHRAPAQPGGGGKASPATPAGARFPEPAAEPENDQLPF
jgi:single-strand DNA-binding protein